MGNGRLMAGGTAQILGQVLTGCALVSHVTGWPDVSVWVVAYLAAAILVPFRHNGSFKDRATGNFGAGIVIAGFLSWEVITSGLGGLVGGEGPGLGVDALMMLAATVLFTVAGAMFWVLREEGASR
jgi:hypothetical protein